MRRILCLTIEVEQAGKDIDHHSIEHAEQSTISSERLEIVFYNPTIIQCINVLLIITITMI